MGAEGHTDLMATPRNDHIIMEMIAEGRLFVCPMHGSVHILGRRMTTPKGVDKDGYVRMKPLHHGRKYELRRCRVVWVYVEGPTRLEVDHKNNQRDDDRYINLDACEHAENDIRKRQRQWEVEQGIVPAEELNDEERGTPYSEEIAW